ncbi:MAG: hypothetical protein NTY89_10610 [Nostocales cyanobacterium LacPavin_0920_SED1_MAG_38_18]|jgi:hypothetical protein|uniref:hypothetical protein n=1 Tax=Anabaena sp. WA102 TaxID=1647413 RepID=UPI0006AC632B|nr:hypothetical protein [Anabaena sp. WA102]ALB39962.1 hypothetical protein AA650_05325 [Anabaena sp. WA102]MCX5982231.1 hypothetical protein [Nostocales cyanobacterium LacPavin_0920_SED1_MAG_38_18]
MSSILNWDNEFLEMSQRIRDIHSSFATINQTQKQETEKLTQLQNDVINLAKDIGVSEDIIRHILDTNLQPSKSQRQLIWEDEIFLNNNFLIIDDRVKEEVFRNPEFLPPLSNLDYAIVGISGLVANILDFLVVKIPKDINYLGKYKQEGSNFTKWLKTLGIDEEGELNPFLKWCEDTCKVSYDQSINQNIKGFNPKTHRLLSLGHDPLFGLIFGTLDIINGNMTAFDINGNLHILKTFDMSLEDKAFAPLIWLGHIISDMSTKMGVPIPGWAFLQLMQFGFYGSDTKTIADISRWMYLNGYDLRHFITMSVPVTVIEIIVRGYHYLSCLDSAEQLQYSLHTSIANRELYQIKSNLKLHKMLFLAHAISASGNALKIFTYAGNPLAINLPQWLFFAKESLTILQAVTRDTTPEKIVRNRDKINDAWDEIKNINI